MGVMAAHVRPWIAATNAAMTRLIIQHGNMKSSLADLFRESMQDANSTHYSGGVIPACAVMMP